MKRIFLIDSPGVVVDAAGDTETDSVLKGVVRAGERANYCERALMKTRIRASERSEQQAKRASHN